MAVIGAGLVGVSLAYELACLGASVTVIDAGHPGRATDAGAGILSPVTSMETEERAVAVPAPGRRPLPGPAAADGSPTASDVAGTGYGRCGMLSVGLRPSRGRVVRPLRRAGAPPGARVRSPRSRRRRPARSSRRSARCTACCTRRVRPGSTAGAWLPPAPPGRGGARRSRRCPVLRTASGAGGVASGAGVHAASRPYRSRGIRTCSATRWPSPVAPGPRQPASGSAQGCPSVPLGGRSCISASARRRASWPIVQPLLTHYLVPWPGGRVACGGTFEAVAGFSVGVTAAGVSTSSCASA